MGCIHLDKSPEAYRVDAVTGEKEPATVHFCTWADAHPDRFLNAPRWLTDWALAGGPNPRLRAEPRPMTRWTYGGLIIAAGLIIGVVGAATGWW